MAADLEENFDEEFTWPSLGTEEEWALALEWNWSDLGSRKGLSQAEADEAELAWLRKVLPVVAAGRDVLRLELAFCHEGELLAQGKKDDAGN